MGGARIAGFAVLMVMFTVLAAGQDRRPASPLAPEATGRRVALVIGNDGYRTAPLFNARNDARAVARRLRELAFDVSVVEDATRATLGTTLIAFARRAEAADVALVFYAGHGVQVEGINYVLPIDFAGASTDEVRLDAISADEIVRALRRARVGVLVLDACRDNPYAGQRSGGRGLAQLEAEGLLVAFSTGAGQTASDSPGEGNSVFTSELLQVLGQEGRGLRDTFFDVQARVQARTNGRQFPAVYSQITGDLVLSPSSGRPNAGSTAAVPGVRADASTPAPAERTRPSSPPVTRPAPPMYQPAPASVAPRFESEFLTVAVESAHFSHDVSGAALSLTLTAESRSRREELVLCLRSTLMDDRGGSWSLAQGTGLATVRHGVNMSYGPGGIAYAPGSHSMVGTSPQPFLMRFVAHSAQPPSSATLSMECYHRRGSVDVPFSIGISRIQIKATGR